MLVKKSFLPLIALLLKSLFSQTPAGIAASGYIQPLPIQAAPGQLITIFAYGIGDRISQPTFADRTPLPTTLAGISITLKQTVFAKDIPVPILGIQPIRAGFVALTVQIPFELIPNLPGAATPPNNATLSVTENGLNAASVDLVSLEDKIQILNSCDLLVRSGLSTCAPLFTHADGTAVSQASPAHSKEVLVMYGVGFGPALPQATTGAPSPNPPAVAAVSSIIGFDFSPNATPTSPPLPAGLLPNDPKIPHPLFVGLTPGFVGLYQVNFQVPAIPQGTSLCNGIVLTNLTVSVGGLSSFDGAGICVGP
jgi:uncharacterized protein (TIGR03437 family)